MSGLQNPRRQNGVKKKKTLLKLWEPAFSAFWALEKWGCGGTRGTEMAQEQGAGEPLKAGAGFSTAPPEHQGVLHG